MCQNSTEFLNVFTFNPLECQSWCIRDIYKTKCYNVKFIQYSWRTMLRVHKQITPDNTHSFSLTFVLIHSYARTHHFTLKAYSSQNTNLFANKAYMALTTHFKLEISHKFNFAFKISLWSFRESKFNKGFEPGFWF